MERSCPNTTHKALAHRVLSVLPLALADYREESDVDQDKIIAAIRGLFPGGRDEFEHDWEDFESSAYCAGALSLGEALLGETDRDILYFLREGWE